jgi:hypothetical protein
MQRRGHIVILFSAAKKMKILLNEHTDTAFLLKRVGGSKNFNLQLIISGLSGNTLSISIWESSLLIPLLTGNSVVRVPTLQFTVSNPTKRVNINSTTYGDHYTDKRS